MAPAVLPRKYSTSSVVVAQVASPDNSSGGDGRDVSR